ncbi:opioid-binding protein/cell adhesion molecule isoform X1 [Patella vulgata]|nr:opioid-binding protein/cell adhesion molecule isoform X1 [Patella vulgata]
MSSTKLLSLNNIKRQQAYNYTCRVTHTQISSSVLSKQLTVIVHYPPSISSLISDATNNMIDDDSGITFTCAVDSFPSSNISWSRSQQGRQLFFGRQYAIPKVSCQHTDNYTCTARNDISKPVSRTIPLYVRCRPVLDPNKDTKTSISVSRGETGVLSIHVLAYPLPVFTWYYQQQDGSERLIIDFRSQQIDDGLSSTLTIQDVTFDDGRKYIVYVNNSLGSRSIVFNMAVLSNDDDNNNNLLGIGIAIGLGIILFIIAIIIVLLWVVFKKTGRRICIQKVTGNDPTLFDDANNQQTRSDNITLSETPPIYERVGTDAVNTTYPSNPGYINTETASSPYEVLDKQTVDQQPNSYQQLDTPSRSTYEVLDKQTIDQQPNTYQQLSPYQNVTRD